MSESLLYLTITHAWTRCEKAHTEALWGKSMQIMAEPTCAAYDLLIRC